MLGNYIIGLREGLEAALVVVVLLAYLSKTGRAHLKPRIWAGIILAILVSVGFGALLTFGPRGLTFQAQEAIGGGLSLVAVGFVTWMIFWMGKASHNMAKELQNKVDGATDRSGGAGWALVFLGAVSVGREGLETALFVWANADVGNGGTAISTLGAVLGILTAVVIGVLLNRGAMKFNLSSFFTWTTYFLVFVAAGIFSYAITDLQEADFLPGIHDYAFDVSGWALEADPSGVGMAILKAVFQLTPAMSKLAFGAWLLYLVIMLPICIWRHRQIIANRRAKAAEKAASATTEQAQRPTVVASVDAAAASAEGSTATATGDTRDR